MEFVCNGCKKIFEEEIICPDCGKEDIEVIKRDKDIIFCEKDNTISFARMRLATLSKQVSKKKRERDFTFNNTLEKVNMSPQGHEFIVTKFLDDGRYQGVSKGEVHRDVLDTFVCMGILQKKFMGGKNHHKYLHIPSNQCIYLKKDQNGELTCLFDWKNKAIKKARKNFEFKKE